MLKALSDMLPLVLADIEARRRRELDDDEWDDAYNGRWEAEKLEPADETE